MKYTAIYVERWQSGSVWHNATKMKRVEKAEDESVLQMLQREGIANETTYLFVGHPLLQGESESELKSYILHQNG